MATKPTQLPEWASDPGADKVAPPDVKKETGWEPLEKPPHQWFNWFQNLVYQWILYLKDFSIENVGIGTNAEFVINADTTSNHEIEYKGLNGADTKFVANALVASGAVTADTVTAVGAVTADEVIAKNTARAFCQVYADGTMQGGGYGVASVNKTSAGVYSITLDTGLNGSKMIASATPLPDGGVSIVPITTMITPDNLGTMTVRTFELTTSSYTDFGFHFIAFGD